MKDLLLAPLLVAAVLFLICLAIVCHKEADENRG